MLNPGEIEVLDAEERKSVEAWEQAIDGRLKQGRGHADIHFDEATTARIRFELARRYQAAGWSVNYRQSGLQSQLIISHPLLVLPDGLR